MKFWPVEYNGQLLVWAALELRAQVDWRELSEIDLGIYTFCYTEIGSEPEKWDPKTRETADHSLPYIFAKVLLDGTISLEAFEAAAYRDPSIRPLMHKIRVYLDPDVEALYPKTISLKIKAVKKDQSVIELWPRNPLGHPNNPMGDADVKNKFLRTVEPILGKAETNDVLQRWWNVSEASATELSALLNLLDQK